MGPVTLDAELAALERARTAVADKLGRVEQLVGIDGGADSVSQEYVDAIIGDTIELLQRDLVVFGRVDDDRTWRIGLYGIDADGDQLVVDWRARFAQGFYQATVGDDFGLRQRVSYVGCIDDLLIEDLRTGEASGSSPLLAELSRSKGELMRAAVATLQSEQDSLVRLHPDDRLVIRGGPGTGKTVVGLHRAAWLVYNDRRITSDRILVVGPSDRFLRYVASVLPTLGERKIRQTTFAELLGPDTPAGGHAEWVEVLDRFEASLVEPAEISVRGIRISADQIAEIADRISASRTPWNQRRRLIIDRTAALRKLPRAEVAKAMAKMVPTCSTAQALKRLRNPDLLTRLGASEELQRDWLAVPEDGGVTDEVRSRIEGVPARYSHAIVDEAQDLTALQLRAVQRRAPGLTLVGDDAQRSHVHGIGLRTAAKELGVEVAEMTTAYRQSAEIVEWLNELAAAHPELDAVEMVGIRPTGTPVLEVAALGPLEGELRERWGDVTTITAEDTWRHQGIEYDAVVVERADMSPRQLYLAASRAAHELVVVG